MKYEPRTSVPMISYRSEEGRRLFSDLKHLNLSNLMVTVVLDRWRSYFWTRVDRTSDCWNWTSNLNMYGYGQMSCWRPRRPIAAHIVSVLLSGRAIPGDWEVDHICMNRRCVRPDHLRVVPPIVNLMENTRAVPAKNRLKTHCKRGHLFDEANTRRFLMPSGNMGRSCRTCMREAQRKWRKS